MTKTVCEPMGAAQSRMADLIPQLIATLGPEAVLTSAHGMSVQGATPVVVVLPSTHEQMSQTVHAACDSGCAVVPWGGGTHQALGRNLTLNKRSFIVASTRKLNRVLQYVPEDMTISVEAGMTFDELDALIKPHGQMLPMDLALPAHATLGGAIAVNADGPRRLGYGTLRDCLLGVTMIEASGRSSKAGGMTVKNVSGYDLMKLYIGSLGTLGIITSANFKLYPRPRAEATITGQFASLAQAFGLIDALQASQLTPSATELRMDDRTTLAVRAEGIADAVQRHIHDLTTMMTQHNARDVQTLQTDAHIAFWASENDMSQTAALEPDEMVLKLTTLPAELLAVLTHVFETTRDLGINATGTARALNGVAYIRADGTAEKLITLHRALLAKHPRVVVMAAPRDVRMQVPIWGNAIAGLEHMQRIKHEFDPHNLLNPGRFVV